MSLQQESSPHIFSLADIGHDLAPVGAASPSEWISQQAGYFRGLENPWAHWLARQIDRLAGEVRFTGGKTPDEHDDRTEVLEHGNPPEADRQWQWQKQKQRQNQLDWTDFGGLAGHPSYPLDPRET